MSQLGPGEQLEQRVREQRGPEQRMPEQRLYRKGESIAESIQLVQSLSYEVLRSLSPQQKGDHACELVALPVNSFADFDYAFGEEQSFAEKFYNQMPDYERLFSGPERRKSSNEDDNDYAAGSSTPDVAMETMTREEAEETVKEINYATMLGTLSDLSYVRRRRFAVWADLNKAELAFIHHLNALTNEVDYSRAF